MNFQTKNKKENDITKNKNKTVNLAHNISIVNKHNKNNNIDKEVIKSVTEIKIIVLLLNFIMINIIQYLVLIFFSCNYVFH